ncbi:MAG: type II toxin-antitoxin system Phd/YefM family antitoxin [Actinobacteria bacterium]|nr:type II toxin-antitoxin system Phd/YefM family antitoxin [Actinomycetota bacterium]MCL5445147.1 type II toxin-antitoxin system Phd/YefM family antitoxin [Actinomycetota bacterium]
MAIHEFPLADARNRLSELVSDVEKTHARVMITKHGHSAAVLISPEDLTRGSHQRISPEDLAAMEETLDVLSDPQALAAIKEAEAEFDRGELTTGEEMAHLLEERRRRETGVA